MFSVRALVPIVPLVLLCLTGCGGGSGSGGPSVPANPPLSAPIPLIEGHQIGVAHWNVGDTASGANGGVTAGLPCGIMDETFHVHSHLSIFVNGQQLAIPAAIGITHPVFTTNTTWPSGFVSSSSGGCYYALHTHDASGKLHMEAAVPTTWSLGQEFAVWGQPLSYTNVAGLTGLPVVVYINDNGTVTNYTGDLAAIQLTSHREITFQIGSPISMIPTYTWYGP